MSDDASNVIQFAPRSVELPCDVEPAFDDGGYANLFKLVGLIQQAMGKAGAESVGGGGKAGELSTVFLFGDYLYNVKVELIGRKGCDQT